MKPHVVIHRLALAALFVVMVMGFISTARVTQLPPASRILAGLGGAGVWGLCLWTIWCKPRTWGLGVGIFALLILGFQTYLWVLAFAKPTPQLRITLSPLGFALYELPLVIAAGSCLALRWCYPKEP